MNRTPFSVYLHIPFCKHRCAYCDFNTYSGLDALIPEYVKALGKEIQISGQTIDKRLMVHTLFWGGGTPSLLSVREIEQIFSALEVSYQILPQVEITLEANPGTVNFEFLHGLHHLGVNRLSLGMQSASPADLRILERQHHLSDVIQAVKNARKAGFADINLDLIFGIPGQTLHSWQNSLAMALSLQPEHLSLYALTLEHGTPMAHWVERGLLEMPDPDLAADMYELACEMLDLAGFVHYEISNWARKSSDGTIRVCRHNLQYWRSLPYLGLGAGAHGYAAGLRTVNVLSPGAYIQRLRESNQVFSFPSTPATVEVHRQTIQEEIGEFMMMGLRLIDEGIHPHTFQERFGQSLEEMFGAEINQLCDYGLLEWRGGSLKLTRRGYLLGNQVFQAFI